MKKKISHIQRWLIAMPALALAVNLAIVAPGPTSDAYTHEINVASEATHEAGYSLNREESENVGVYQQNIASVISINSGKNQGAGVILTRDGLVVTSRHVIKGTSVVNIKTHDQKAYKAQVVSMGDPNTDLAFLKIVANQGFPSVRLGDSSAVRVGQRVLAIGNPFGLEGTMTTGIVSRIDRQRNLIQTDAAINPGNSGGPLFNTQGDLIGINRSIVNPVGPSSAGVSFAVPVNVVKQKIASLGNYSVVAAN